MKQSSFSDLEYQSKKKTTRMEKFLSEMDAILPWKLLLKPIRKHYPKAGSGRPPMALETMLRIYFMQQWYQLSNPAMEDSLYDIEAMPRFAQVTLDSIPDESTILHFRHLLEAHELTKKLFQVTEHYMLEQGLILSEGTIVDASIISAAPSSTKNKDRQRDPDMKQTKKDNQWYFGMKTHIGTDPQGCVHSIVVTDASVNDFVVVDELIHGEETVLYGDKAYASQARKEASESQGVTWRINRKAQRGKKLNCADRSFNRKSNRTRSRVEHAFDVVKHLWKYRKVRYKGLEKNAAQVFTLFALSNLYMVRKELAIS